MLFSTLEHNLSFLSHERAELVVVSQWLVQKLTTSYDVINHVGTSINLKEKAT